MTPEREQRIKHMISRRQKDLGVVLDNVNDPHNIFAVLRSCDSVGIQNVYVIDPDGIFRSKFEYGKRSSASSSKWVNVHIYDNSSDCFQVVRKKHTNILGTYLGESATSLFELDLTISTALVFGNEKDGISDETRKYCDHQFFIPQVGMIKSLNISVACAVSLYEAYRQRTAKGCYEQPTFTPSEQVQLFNEISRKQID